MSPSEGGLGPLYNGSIDGNLLLGLAMQQVAVKYLNLDGGSVQGHRDWLVRFFGLGLASIAKHV
jgi:hypothetical protein